MASAPLQQLQEGQEGSDQASYYCSVEADVLQVRADLLLDLGDEMQVGQLIQAAPHHHTDLRVAVLHQFGCHFANPGVQRGLRFGIVSKFLQLIAEDAAQQQVEVGTGLGQLGI